MKYNICWISAADDNCIITLTKFNEFSTSRDSDTGAGLSPPSKACVDLVDLALRASSNKKSILGESERDNYFNYKVWQ